MSLRIARARAYQVTQQQNDRRRKRLSVPRDQTIVGSRRCGESQAEGGSALPTSAGPASLGGGHKLKHPRFSRTKYGWHNLHPLFWQKLAQNVTQTHAQTNKHVHIYSFNTYRSKKQIMWARLGTVQAERVHRNQKKKDRRKKGNEREVSSERKKRERWRRSFARRLHFACLTFQVSGCHAMWKRDFLRNTTVLSKWAN